MCRWLQYNRYLFFFQLLSVKTQIYLARRAAILLENNSELFRHCMELLKPFATHLSVSPHSSWSLSPQQFFNLWYKTRLKHHMFLSSATAFTPTVGCIRRRMDVWSCSNNCWTETGQALRVRIDVKPKMKLDENRKWNSTRKWKWNRNWTSPRQNIRLPQKWLRFLFLLHSWFQGIILNWETLTKCNSYLQSYRPMFMDRRNHNTKIEL